MRGDEVHDFWDRMFDPEKREVRLLYITGKGFDPRSETPIREIVSSLYERKVGAAKLLLVDFNSYELDRALIEATEENTKAIKSVFSSLGDVEELSFQGEHDEDDITSSVILLEGVKKVLPLTEGYTDIILDVTSFPRMVYIALLTGILSKLIPNKEAADQDSQLLAAGGVNFQVVVAEDPSLDSSIIAEDPSDEILFIPGFSGTMQSELVRDWPMVWFPFLGEGRLGQLDKIRKLSDISMDAEVCPVIPHPSKNLRRADNLLVEYSEILIDSLQTPMSNVFHVNEANPFEVYRQLLKAMRRYKDSMKLLGGCQLIVSPLGSKLMTIGASLACFEMKTVDLKEQYIVTIPHAEPRRYSMTSAAPMPVKSEISALVLTGEAFS